MSEQPYLTVYDYGQGGVWNSIIASSAAAITEAYPELRIVAEPPDWLDLERTPTIRLDDAEDEFLAALRSGRTD